MHAKLMSPVSFFRDRSNQLCVSGHDFSRAVQAAHDEGFSPCGPLSIPVGLCAAFASSSPTRTLFLQCSIAAEVRFSRPMGQSHVFSRLSWPINRTNLILFVNALFKAINKLHPQKTSRSANLDSSEFACPRKGSHAARFPARCSMR